MPTNFFKRLSKALLILFLCFVLLLFSCFPKRYMATTLDGIKIWATCVLPASLPFLFFTALLTQTGFASRLSKLLSPVTKRIFSLSGVSAYCLCISLISGYPVGAKTVSDLYSHGLIGRSESTKMGLLCSTSSPMFLLGSVGAGMFCDGKIGVILLTSHLLGTLLWGFFLAFYKTENGAPSPVFSRTDNVLYESMYSSVLACLCVGGFVAVFYTLSMLLADWGLLSPISNALSLLGLSERNAEAFSVGLIEMTNGCKLLSLSKSVESVCLAEFLVSFGGVSILFQQLAFLKKAEVKSGVFLLGKLIFSTLCTLVCLCICLLFL